MNSSSQIDCHCQNRLNVDAKIINTYTDGLGTLIQQLSCLLQKIVVHYQGNTIILSQQKEMLA